MADPIESPAPVLIEPLMHEPWVKLADGRDLADWGKEEEIAYNQAHRQMGKYDMFVKAYDFLKENRVFGDYHEYGCHRCRTFRMSLTEARRRNLDGMKFFAFDSFEGLPEVESGPSVEIWKQGALTTSEDEFLRLVTEHGIYADRVVTVKGFYDESLTRELQSDLLENENKISLVTVDCDLYESAVPVFQFIEPLLQEGSLIYIDDLFCGYRGSPRKGVAQAFLEFQEKSRFQFLPHMNVGWWGRTYITYVNDGDLKVAL